jgi:hypothetical protein
MRIETPMCWPKAECNGNPLPMDSRCNGDIIVDNDHLSAMIQHEY